VDARSGGRCRRGDAVSAPVVPAAELTQRPDAPADAAKALPKGVTRSSDIAANAFARVLLLAPPKVGKTTSILTTAPKPLHINCDGEGASTYAAGQGSDFLEVRVDNLRGVGARANWAKAREVAKQLVASGEVQSIVVDTITLLANNLVEDASIEFNNYDKWNEVESQLVGGFKRLFELPVHIFVLGHLDPRKDAIEGSMPLIPGKAKAYVPAMCADWVLLEYNEAANPKRRFLLGPQPGWTAGGRNLKRSTTCEATVPALFEELGIPL
jgi:hypothetical protein